MDWWKAPPARCSWTRSAGPGGNQQRTVRGGGLDAVHAIRGQVLRAGWREIAEETQTGRADALLWDPARGPLARWTGRSCSAAKSKNARRRLQYGRPCRFACATPQVRRLARQRGANAPRDRFPASARGPAAYSSEGLRTADFGASCGSASGVVRAPASGGPRLSK